jgi:hypothetical protein
MGDLISSATRGCSCKSISPARRRRESSAPKTNSKASHNFVEPVPKAVASSTMARCRRLDSGRPVGFLDKVFLYLWPKKRDAHIRKMALFQRWSSVTRKGAASALIFIAPGQYGPALSVVRCFHWEWKIHAHRRDSRIHGSTGGHCGCRIGGIGKSAGQSAQWIQPSLSLRRIATRIIGIEVAAAGVLIQLVCLWNSLNPFDTSNRDMVNFFFCVGTIAVAVGCGVYAKGKGRHPAFGLLGVLSIPGFFVLSLLKDGKSAENAANPSQKAQ